MKKIISDEKSAGHKLTTVLIIISLTFVMLISSADAVSYAYIDGNYNNVSIIDIANNSVIDTIDVGFHPMGIAVNKEGTRAYLTGGGSFSVINTETNNVLDTILIGGAPQGVAVTPDGKKAYVTDPANNRIDVIDTATNNITATLAVSVWPIGVAVNPAGTKAYVTNLRSSTVSVIDIATNSFTTWVNVGFHPRGVTVTPDGTKVFVTNTGNQTVSVIDTATNTVINTVNVGIQPWGVAASPDGKKVYVANYWSNNTSVIDTATNTVIGTVDVGINPFGVSVTPDGSKAYVANNGDGTVSIINTTTNTVTDTINVGGTPFAFGQFISSDPAQQIPPVANFTINVTSGSAPLFVQFTDKSTGSPTSWSWDFNNDGIADSREQNPTYTYANPGTYVSRLTVSNAKGYNSKNETITVLQNNGEGSSHSSRNSDNKGKVIIVRNDEYSNSTENTNATGTIMQSENATPSFGQNEGIEEGNVEQTSEPKQETTTPETESKKTRGFEIIYVVVSLLASFCINERKSK